MSQTSNPKKPFLVWNKPKASTYCAIAGVMYLDGDNHVQFHGLTEYSDTAEAIRFRDIFGAAVPESRKAYLDKWIKAKLAYDALKASKGDII